MTIYQILLFTFLVISCGRDEFFFGRWVLALPCWNLLYGYRLD